MVLPAVLPLGVPAVLSMVSAGVAATGVLVVSGGLVVVPPPEPPSYLFFSTQDGNNNSQLGVYDGASVNLITSVNASSNGLRPYGFVSVQWVSELGGPVP